VIERGDVGATLTASNIAESSERNYATFRINHTTDRKKELTMIKTKTLSVLAATFAMAFAPAAFAGDMHKSDADKVDKAAKMQIAKPNVTLTPRTTEIRSEIAAEVRGAIARGDMIAVEGTDGTTYFNQLIPVSELPDPTLDVQIVDTVTFEHNGVTYTNKIVNAS
jgi:hypothetical protein